MDLQERMKELSTVKGKEGHSTRLDLTETLLYLAMVGAYHLIKEGKDDGETQQHLERIIASQLRSPTKIDAVC